MAIYHLAKYGYSRQMQANCPKWTKHGEWRSFCRFCPLYHISEVKVLLSSHGISYLSYFYSCCFRCRPIAISLTNSMSFVIIYLGPCQLFSIKCFKPRNLSSLPHARENMGVKWTKIGECPIVMSHSTYQGEGENIDLSCGA